jgi:hypothetical protein
MSAALSGRRSNYRYNEGVEESEREYEERPKWDSIEARMVEMGLSWLTGKDRFKSGIQNAVTPVL